LSEHHEHAWKPSNCKFTRRDSDPVTTVILHCECGAFDYNVLPGQWTLEELQPVKAPIIKPDTEILKEMGITRESPCI
jgi:hypothetical protein